MSHDMAVFMSVLTYLRWLPYSKRNLVYIRFAVNTKAFNYIIDNEQSRINNRLGNHKAGTGAAGKKWRTACAFFFGRRNFA
jgi:hypothetical protein